MLLLDPPPLPDESLYSLLCRASLTDAGFTHRKTLKYTFDPMERASDLEMIGRQIVSLWKTCLSSRGALAQCIEDTTLFRLYAPLLPARHRGYIKKWVGRNPVSIRLILEQHFLVESLNLYYLKYCPQCIRTDIERHGVPYWHRSHCCQWAFACHEHRCELVKVGFLRSGSECFQLPDYSLAGKGKACSLLIEETIFRWLNQPAEPMPEPDRFRQQLCQRICAQFSDRVEVSSAALQQEIQQKISPARLKQLDIHYQYPDGSERPWVSEALLAVGKQSLSEILLMEHFARP